MGLELAPQDYPKVSLAQCLSVCNLRSSPAHLAAVLRLSETRTLLSNSMATQ